MAFSDRIPRSRFLRDSATLQVAALFNNLGNLVSTFALAHVLGARMQGEYYLAVATWSFLWFTVNLGLTSVVTSQVAAAVARKNRLKVAAWLAWLLKSSLVLGGGATVLAWLVLPGFSAFLYDSRDVGVLAAVLGLTPLVEFGRVVVCAGLQGARRMGALARVENAQEYLRVALVITGALVTGDALGPILGNLVASGCGSLLAVSIYVREEDEIMPGVRTILREVRGVPIRHGLRLGLRMGLVRNVDAYGVQILPAMIMGALGNEAWVAYLRLAQRFTDVARTFMQGINRTALPHFSEIVGLKEIAKLPRAYWRATLLSGLLISSGLLLSLLVMPWVVGFFPLDYRDPVWTIYKILVPGVMIVSFSVANDTFYLVTNTIRVGVLLSFLGLAVNTTVVAVLAWMYPKLGVAYGLAFTFTWSLVHISYAAYWFRKNRIETKLSV